MSLLAKHNFSIVTDIPHFFYGARVLIMNFHNLHALLVCKSFYNEMAAYKESFAFLTDKVWLALPTSAANLRKT